MQYEIHLHDRIDVLSESAEEYLEEIPTSISPVELESSKEFLSIYYLYEECVDMIDTIREELSSGAPIQDVIDEIEIERCEREGKNS